MPGVVAIKDATGSMDTASEVSALPACAGLAQLSGDDALTVPFMSLGERGGGAPPAHARPTPSSSPPSSLLPLPLHPGCTGVVSVASNVAPERVVAMVAAALAGAAPKRAKRRGGDGV